VIVCLCEVATDRDIAAAIADGAHTVEQVGRRCGAGTGCGSCRDFILDMLEESRASCSGTGCGDCALRSSREAA
jgi:bacterioferritin-associated ferredoxin